MRCGRIVANRFSKRDSLSASLRRQQQINRLRTSAEKADGSPLSDLQPSRGGGAVPIGNSATDRGTVDSFDGNAVSVTGNRALAGHLLNATSPEMERATSPRLREVHDAIECAGTKKLVVQHFQEQLAAADVAPTGATFLAVANALLHRHVESVQGDGGKKLEREIAEAVGSGSERWAVDPEERAAYINYWCRTHERWAVKKSSFNVPLGRTIEGEDNDAVSLLEFQMHKHGVSPPVSAFADLMHLDISWTTALRLYNTCARSHSMQPPVEMTDRLTGLMTGYRGDAGSRPWIRALTLYENLLRSGYEPTLTSHTNALDAMWRSTTVAFRPGSGASPRHLEAVWSNTLAICRRVDEDTQLGVRGEEGCAFAESLIKTVSATGRWEVAIAMLANMDVQREEVSFRMLTPTPETLAFAIIACNASQHATHTSMLLQLFREMYRFHDLHPEVLTQLLQSFRTVARTFSQVGVVIEAALQEMLLLDRRVAVSCLQLLAMKDVRLPPMESGAAEKWLTAARLFHSYHANAWPQQPSVRRIELHTVFRACQVIVAEGGGGGAATDTTRHPLICMLERYLSAAFGAKSEEMEWLRGTALHALLNSRKWDNALRIFSQLTENKEATATLSMPLRQAKCFLLACFANSIGGKTLGSEFWNIDGAADLRDGDENSDDDGIVVGGDEEEMEKHQERKEAVSRHLFRVATRTFEGDDVMPFEELATLLMCRSLAERETRNQRQCAVEAMELLGVANASLISVGLLRSIGEVLDLTELHINNTICERHPQLRHAVLRRRSEQMSSLPSRQSTSTPQRVSAWEAVYS